ncbi:MAG: hypothetical protein ACXQTD_05935 [Candidatus Syntropharchaeia archaeon]
MTYVSYGFTGMVHGCDIKWCLCRACGHTWRRIKDGKIVWDGSTCPECGSSHIEYATGFHCDEPICGDYIKNQIKEFIQAFNR